MGAIKKISMTGDDDLFEELSDFRKPEEPKADERPAAKPVKKMMNFKVTEEFESNLRAYCLKKDMTMTAVIKRAVMEKLEREGEWQERR